MSGPGRSGVRPAGSWPQRPEKSIAVACVEAVTWIVIALIAVITIIYCLKDLTALKELGNLFINAAIKMKDGLVYIVGHGVIFGVVGGKIIEYFTFLWFKINSRGQSSGVSTP